MVNQADETVLTQTNWVMFATRDAEPFSGGGRQFCRRRGDSLPGDHARREIPPISSNPYFEDLVIGETEELGSYTFTPDEIIRFAKQYDPQRFHVDAEAAKGSLFGGALRLGLAYGERVDEAHGRPPRPHPRLCPRPRPAPGPARPLPGLHQPEMAQARLCGRHDHLPHHRDGQAPLCLAPRLGLGVPPQHAARTSTARRSSPSTAWCSGKGGGERRSGRPVIPTVIPAQAGIHNHDVQEGRSASRLFCTVAVMDPGLRCASPG